MAFVALEDYCHFLRDEKGALRRHIFDGNVRDFQGDVEVNKAIAASLQDKKAPQFWWLNNGVTILASAVSIVGKRFQLDNPQIVNGLQTSVVIHESLPRRKGKTKLARRLLVRIIEEGDEKARDRIIRSTNSQTSVPTASLRATDELQRDIETFFLLDGWFYDRRKNYWKNEQKPAERIVQITYLAQAILGICLGDPSSARARPSSLLKEDLDYAKVFNPHRRHEIYLWAAKTQKAVDSFLRSEEGVTAEERSNLKFHLSALLVTEALGRCVEPGEPNDVQDLAGREFSATETRETFLKLRDAMGAYRQKTGQAMDRAAKSSDFFQGLLNEYFPLVSRKAGKS